MGSVRIEKAKRRTGTKKKKSDVIDRNIIKQLEKLKAK